MKQFKDLLIGLLVFLLYILVPEILNTYLPAITDSTTIELLYRFMFLLLLLIAFVLIYKKDLYNDFIEYKKNSWKIIKKSLLYFVIIVVGYALISTIIYAIYPDFIYANDSVLFSLSKKNPVLILLYSFVITCFTEQIVFRKVFKDIINNKYFYIIFSSMVYAVFQIGYTFDSINDLLSLIPYTFAGCVLATSYIKTNNFYTPCLVYIFYNLFSLVGTLLLS